MKKEIIKDKEWEGEWLNFCEEAMTLIIEYGVLRAKYPDRKKEIDKKEFELRRHLKGGGLIFIEDLLRTEYQQGYQRGRLRCLQQHGLDKEIKEAKEQERQAILKNVDERIRIYEELVEKYGNEEGDRGSLMALKDFKSSIEK